MKKEIFCPFCNSKKVVRIHRSKEIRLIPYSKLYECRSCNGEFVTVLNMIKLKFTEDQPELVSSKI